MDIFQLLTGQSNTQKIGEQLGGVQPDQLQSALQAAVPLLLGALARNAEQGQASAIAGAVAEHDSRALEQFAQGQLPDLQDGQKILGHVFGQQQQAAATAVGQRSGIDPKLAMQILSMAAPLVLAYLNRQSKGTGKGAGAGLPQTGLQGGDITGLLTGVLGSLLGGGLGAQQQGQVQGQGAGFGAGDLGSLLGTLNRTLDRDGDGNALNELVAMLGRR